MPIIKFPEKYEKITFKIEPNAKEIFLNYCLEFQVQIFKPIRHNELVVKRLKMKAKAVTQILV